MSECEKKAWCRFEFQDYELELTIPLSSLTEGQIRGATDLFLKFLGQKIVAEIREKLPKEK